MSMLHNLNSMSVEELQSECISKKLYDPTSTCTSWLTFKFHLKNKVERYLRPHLSKSDIDNMNDAELRSAARKRGLLESGVDSNELKKELMMYEEIQKKKGGMFTNIKRLIGF